MTRFTADYRDVRAPTELERRLLDGYRRANVNPVRSWPAPAAAFTVLLLTGVLALQQPPPGAPAYQPLALPSLSTTRLAGMTTDIGALSRLTASDLQVPAREIPMSMPSMPRMPEAPNS